MRPLTYNQRIFVDSSTKQGDIWLYDYTQTPSAEKSLLRKLERERWPANQEFHPLGIEFHAPSNLLFVVNHAVPPSIEVFKLSPARDKLVYERTFRHERLHAPNSMSAINDHELYVTNDHYFLARTFKPAALAETYLGIPGGSVMRVDLATAEVRQLARGPFPNGVQILNATHLAVACTGAAHVRVYAVDPDTGALSLAQTVKVHFGPDNLHLDGGGRLLIAGHPFAPSLVGVAATQRRYALDGPEEGKKPMAERPRAPSWVAEWDGNGEGTVRDLYVGTEFGSSCGAARDSKRGVGIIGGLYESGILLWKD